MRNLSSVDLLSLLETSVSSSDMSVAELRTAYTYAALFLAHNFRHFDPRIAVLTAELERRIISIQAINVTPSLLSTVGESHGTTT